MYSICIQDDQKPFNLWLGILRLQSPSLLVQRLHRLRERAMGTRTNLRKTSLNLRTAYKLNFAITAVKKRWIKIWEGYYICNIVLTPKAIHPKLFFTHTGHSTQFSRACYSHNAWTTTWFEMSGNVVKFILHVLIFKRRYITFSVVTFSPFSAVFVFGWWFVCFVVVRLFILVPFIRFSETAPSIMAVFAGCVSAFVCFPLVWLFISQSFIHFCVFVQGTLFPLFKKLFRM